MPFLSVSLHNFRNIADSTIDLLAKEVYFVGENGQGKSNMLESLYLSAYGSSFKATNDNEIIKNGESFFGIRTIYKDSNERTHSITVKYKDHKKKIEKNTKNITDRKELLHTIPCILFNHDDLDFAVGSPDRKRFFIDQSLSLLDKDYVDIFRAYKKIVKSRNLVLKEQNYSLLDSLDYQLAEKGLEIIQKREHTIVTFNTIFSKLYEETSKIDNVSIEYAPSWKGSDIKDVLAFLSEKRVQDQNFGITLTGPHRDKIRFVRQKKDFVATASTGQRRLLSLVLRTAQAQYYSSVTGKLPVLLMDDVLLELDPDKRQKFTSLLPDYDQLVCTFLPGEPYEKYLKKNTKIYMLKNGTIYE